MVTKVSIIFESAKIKEVLMKKILVPVLSLLLLISHSYADERGVNPEFKSSEKEGSSKEGYETKVVESRRQKDSEKIGSYNQPVWTAKRRFPTTRVYLLPENKVEVEYWLLMEGNLEDNTDPKYTGIYEIEFGLGHRLQSDFYFKTVQNGSSAPIEVLAQSIELRYAFFDWGRFFGNPTVYLEWIRQSSKPQKGEFKLLLGDEITDRLFWGANLIFEREFGGKSGNEYGLSAGIAYSVIDGVFSTGLEAKVVGEDNQTDRLNLLEKKFLIGPSLLYKPVPAVNLIFTPLFGYKIENEDGEEEGEGVYAIYFIIGVDL